MSGSLRRAPLWRLGLGVGALVLVVGLGLGAIVVGALKAARAERELAHQVLADRAFDAMEAELSTLVATEEARSFLQYRRTYTPEGLLSGRGARVLSPLAAPPADPAVLGYFQVDPDGRVSTPMMPEDGEDPEDPARVERVLALAGQASSLGWAPAPTGEGAPVEQQGEPVLKGEPLATNQYTVQQSLSKGSAPRSKRSGKEEKVATEEIASFQTDWIRNPLSRDAGSGSASRYADAGKDEPAPATRARGLGAELNPEAQDVQISPLRGAPVGEDHLALYRDVTLAGQVYRQGMVLDLRATADLLAYRAVADSLLARFAVVQGPGDLEPADARARRRYAHTFAPPFEALSATLWMQPVPDQGSSLSWILWLSVALGLVGSLGLLAVGGQVLATVRFAERRSNFVAAVSHELKTPLTAIRMYAEMLRDDLVSSEEKRRSYYEIITLESERLTRLIQNVLELAKLERGARSMALEVGDPAQVLQDVARMLGPHAAERGFDLVVEAQPGGTAAYFDRDALTQVLVNLVDNAVKFSSEARDRRIVLRVEQNPGWISVWVRDHGPGVPPRQLRRVFEPFFRGERELTRKTQGTGIGLALVGGLIRGMGGRVKASNAPDGGFLVELRLARA